MTASRLVILGASGFVGTTLTERARSREGWEVVPVIHSAGSAWRLGRRGEALVQVDIGDRAALAALLGGATHVVNCTRGGHDVMIDGLAHVLAECRRAGVARFVHLSSVLVYGDPPPAPTWTEDGPVDDHQAPDSYGGMKLKQDRMVERAAREGLPSVVLCPPNISGPFSLYLCSIVDGLRKGSFGLVGDGSGPCNLIDVRTLCHAIELALDAKPAVADGRRMFVTDGSGATWRELVAELSGLAEAGPPRHVERELLARRVREQAAQPLASLRSTLRHLVSSDVRTALRKDPLLAKVDRLARSSVARMGPRIEGRLRRNIEGTTPVPRVDPLLGLHIGLCAQQLREVLHSPERARQLLGFEPPIGWRQSMVDFREWYRSAFGLGGDSWELARHLYRL